MINARNALARQVKRFFEYDLAGLIDWESAEELVTEADDDRNERVAIGFKINGRGFRLELRSPALEPPLGYIKLVGADNQLTGPIDETTWTKMAIEIRHTLERSSATQAA